MNLKDYITEWISSGKKSRKQQMFSSNMYLDEWLDTLKLMGYDILHNSGLGTDPDKNELVASLISFSSSGEQILGFWYRRRLFSFRFNGKGIMSKTDMHSVSDVDNPNRCKVDYPESIVDILNKEIDKK
jgi:hypothetical protein